MPAHANPLSMFIITSWRDKEIFDCQIAPDPDRAMAVAIAMLTELAPLQHGDKLDIVVGEAPDVTLPEVSRASHYGG